MLNENKDGTPEAIRTWELGTTSENQLEIEEAAVKEEEQKE